MASFKSSFVIWLLVLSLFLVFATASNQKRNVPPLKQLASSIRDAFTPLQFIHSRAKEVSTKKAMNVENLNSFECGLCVIAINEVEGFIAENLTLSEMEKQLDSDICSHLSGTLETVCDNIVLGLPFIINRFESFAQVGPICVDFGLCAQPWSDNHPDPVSVPSYTIDLDLPPSQRWQEICSVPAFQQAAIGLVKSVTSVLPNGGADLEQTGKLLNDYYFPYEFAQEIVGCAQYLGVSYGWLSLINIGYEATDACTSIIAQTESGEIYHARNLDFWSGLWLTDSLKNMTFQAEFQKGGNLLFHATTFAGYAGVLSGQKPNGFSVTIDTRFYPNGVGQLFYEIIAAIEETNSSLVSFLSRNVLTNDNDFPSALNDLSNTHLIADVYYILAGVSAGQGAVISRNRLNATDVWMLDSPSRWFEVETNYDHWNPPPWFDDRVAPANAGMNAMGQKNLTLQGMFHVLSTKPVFNIQTTYSILSCPAQGIYQSFTRFCPWPCTE